MADIVEINCETGEVTERDFTAEELAQREVDAAAFAEQQAAKEAEDQRIAGLKASAKAKLVAGEPLTEEEAALLTI